MMRALILLHRWLGVAFCLLFAMWFASGIVMHFVPFPALTEAARFAGLAPIDLARASSTARRKPSLPADSAMSRACDCCSEATARSIWSPAGRAVALARRRSFGCCRAFGRIGAGDRARITRARRSLEHVERRRRRRLIPYDQWTVSEQFDRYRPLYRIALNDASGTEIYVSSATGEIVLDTTRRQRAWNYVGSVAHWIYPTALRSHAAAWSRLVWWLSLLALIGATAGALIGTLRIGAEGSRWCRRIAAGRRGTTGSA